ncbi:MAG: hypothetical protein EXR07_21150 [Acetobacteraceae bacterium]|nr:hypothetical protein [Acetobacteraceae bacterium]
MVGGCVGVRSLGAARQFTRLRSRPAERWIPAGRPAFGSRRQRLTGIGAGRGFAANRRSARNQRFVNLRLPCSSSLTISCTRGWRNELGRIPIPKPGVLASLTYLGHIYGERRWRGPRGILYTWDALHGEIEYYDSRGRHRGALDGVTGAQIKPPRKGRRIRV